MTSEDSESGAPASAASSGRQPCSRAARLGELLVAEVGEQLVDLEDIHEHVARLAALKRTHDTGLGELIDQACRTRVSDAQLALEERGGGAPFRGNRVRRLGKQRIAFGRVTGPGYGRLDGEDLFL